ncbi:MAG: hypothetical protein M3R02_03160 [Chloroflexota bacterium]|nr:hypothetical protein [Chloroflexota bacterium]
MVTRWLTFLGDALAAGDLLSARFIAPAGTVNVAAERRRAWAVVGGVLTPLLATLAEPALQTAWPTAGTVAPDFSDAISALPSAWWLRPAALLSVLALGLGLTLAGHRPRRATPVAE